MKVLQETGVLDPLSSRVTDSCELLGTELGSFSRVVTVE